MAGPSTGPPPQPSDFQQSFGFSSRLRAVTAREIARITRSNRHSRLAAGAFGSFLVFAALEFLSPPSDQMYSQYWRVYRCNFEMMVPWWRIGAARRYVNDDQRLGVAVNWFYHQHLIRRLADVCEREEARSKGHTGTPIVNLGEVMTVLADICRMYTKSKGTHVHSELTRVVRCVSSMVHRGAECNWPAFWEVVGFLLTNDRNDRKEVLYCVQVCLEARSGQSGPPPGKVVEEVVRAVGEAIGEVELQAAKDVLTLLLLKHRPCLTSSRPPPLGSDPQSLFLLKHWPINTE